MKKRTVKHGEAVFDAGGWRRAVAVVIVNAVVAWWRLRVVFKLAVRQVRRVGYCLAQWREGIKPGDLVILTGTAADGERGWSERWHKGMHGAVQDLGVVVDRSPGARGLRVSFFRSPFDFYSYPYWLLQRVMPDDIIELASGKFYCAAELVKRKHAIMESEWSRREKAARKKKPGRMVDISRGEE